MTDPARGPELHGVFLQMLSVHLGGTDDDELKVEDHNLMDAAMMGQVEDLRRLLAGAAAVPTTKKLSQLLFLAGAHGHPDIVGLLLRAGADVNKTRKSDGFTALHIACAEGHKKVVQLLLQAGADPDKGIHLEGASVEITPFLLSLQKRHIDIVELLLQAGARILPNYLFLAARDGEKDVVKMLLRAGADANGVPENEDSPLSLASKNGHAGVVEVLLQAGADPDKSCKSRTSPLFMASQNGRKDVVELLLRAGADKEKASSFGKTAYFAASHGGFRDVAQLLLRAGADPDKTLLLQLFPDCCPTPQALQAVIANNFRAVRAPRPPLQKLQHSAIHLAITLLKQDHNAALPVAREILATFPGSHPSLPQLRHLVHPLAEQPVPGPTHLPEELRAKLIAELIDEDSAKSSKKTSKKKK